MRWNPWRALRDRPHITLAFDGVADVGGGGLYGARGDVAAIVLSPGLGRRERSAALAHELVHDEARSAGTGHHEARIDDEVARRLVPLDELEAWVRARAEVGAVTVRDVAEEFDVAESVAARAAALLRVRRSMAADQSSVSATASGDHSPAMR